MDPEFRIVLLACYELGRQPFSVAWPAAVLRREGFAVRSFDLSLDPFPRDAVADAELVAIAAPMHTAMRIAAEAAALARKGNSGAHICIYGLYAHLNASYLLRRQRSASLADSVISGEVEAPLLALAQALASGRDISKLAGVATAPGMSEPHLVRPRLPLPDRSDLPSPDRYAHYMSDGRAVPAGSVEASRGCLHTCRHCPVVPVYQGRFFVIPLETVVADVRQQVEQGVQHISFADPDFLNGPGHALQVAQALHAEFPGLTFDFTTKVEHILERRKLLPQLARLGATFVVSAFEATGDHILARLQKGHTAADMEAALKILAQAGLAVQPTWVPFTPWTSLEDYLQMLTWIRSQGLIPNVPTVQLSIRLLVPPRSALLDHPDVAEWCGPLDEENFTYTWRHPDPRMDELQQEVARLAEHGPGQHYAAFHAVEHLAHAAAGSPPPEPAQAPLFMVEPPRLTEDWFC